jgi:predicted outer membrane protein
MIEWEAIGAGLTPAERAEIRKAKIAFEIEERAAIKEFCGNMPREQAEAEARVEVMAKYPTFGVRKG